MKKSIFLIAMLTLATFNSPCSAQENKLEGVSHGEEKAYTGDEKAGQLEELRLSVLKDERTFVVLLDVKYNHHYYEVMYDRDGKRGNKLINEIDVKELQETLAHIYKDKDYYQEYKSTKGENGLRWRLSTNYKNAKFNIKGENVDYKDFAIMNFVLNYFDNIFEFNIPDKPFPEGKLVYFHYSHKGSMRPGGPEWTVERMDDGKYKVTYMDDSMKYMGEELEKKEIKCDANLGEDLCEIFRQGKIQNYRGHYSNPGVLDGSSWNFEVKFEEGTWVRTGGYMDGPRDMSGINNSINYLKELMGMK